MSKDTSSETGKKRISRACLPCHRAKVSCDNSRPCQRCLGKNCADQCEDYTRKIRRRASVDFDLDADNKKMVVRPVRTSADTQTMSLHGSVPTPSVPRSMPRSFIHYRVFGGLLKVFEATLQQHNRLPDFTTLTQLLGWWYGSLTSEQVRVLSEYLSSFGDSSYRQGILSVVKQLSTTVLKPLTLVTSEPVEFKAEQLDFLPCPVFFSHHDFTSNTIFEYHNAHMHAALGYEPQELNQLWITSFFDRIEKVMPVDLVVQTVHDTAPHVLANRLTYSFDTTLHRKDGQMIPAKVRISNRHHAKSRSWLAFFHVDDIHYANHTPTAGAGNGSVTVNSSIPQRSGFSNQPYPDSSPVHFDSTVSLPSFSFGYSHTTAAGQSIQTLNYPSSQSEESVSSPDSELVSPSSLQSVPDTNSAFPDMGSFSTVSPYSISYPHFYQQQQPLQEHPQHQHLHQRPQPYHAYDPANCPPVMRHSNVPSSTVHTQYFKTPSLLDHTTVASTGAPAATEVLEGISEIFPSFVAMSPPRTLCDSMIDSIAFQI